MFQNKGQVGSVASPPFYRKPEAPENGARGSEPREPGYQRFFLSLIQDSVLHASLPTLQAGAYWAGTKQEGRRVEARWRGVRRDRAAATGIPGLRLAVGEVRGNGGRRLGGGRKVGSGSWWDGSGVGAGGSLGGWVITEGPDLSLGSE